MERNEDENLPEMKSPLTTVVKEEECHGMMDVQEVEKKDEVCKGTDGSFKVPDDVAFRRPTFTKAPKNVTAPCDITEDAASGSEEGDPQKESTKSHAQQLVEKDLPVPYKEPSWSGLPKHNYFFEVLKNGTIIRSIPLNKPFVVIGRLAQCDVVLQHPSLSRFHCVIQYCATSCTDQEEGFYAYDLASTHGSFHNKHQMKPSTYYRLRVGHMIKFGGSSQMFLLQGPEDDQEPESELTVTELKAEAVRRAEKLRSLDTGEVDEDDRDCRVEEVKVDGSQLERAGIDWGMGEDAEEDEAEEGENPFAKLNEDLYLNDPKKTLRGWFEREGYDLPEYVAEDMSPGVFKVKLELPIPGPGGGPLVAIVEHRGRKKAAVIQCALEACRLLDKQGVLRQARHESHEKKKRDWAQDDYYDSDEDDFLDRTGDVQRKRLRRMKTSKGMDDGGAETYGSLMAKYKEAVEELSSLEKKLIEAEQLKRAAEDEDEDDLDSFMRSLKRQIPDKHKRVNWKLRTVELRKEEMKLRRLANVAKPFDKPELQPYISAHGLKPNLLTPSRQPFRRPSESLRQEEKDKVGMKETTTKPAIPRVHSAFLEEEPRRKAKLGLLDDGAPELKPIPYKSAKPKPRFGVAKATDKARQVSLPDMAGGCPRREVGDEKEGMTRMTSDVEESEEKILLPTGEAVFNPEKTNAVSQLEDDDTASLSQPEKTTTTTCKEGRQIEDSQQQRVLGPTLPPQEFLRPQQQQEQPKARKKAARKSTVYDTDPSKYETWVPPPEQTGDGRTRLNEKFGY